MKDDPIRLNLPSASSFSLTALCPGREALLREIGNIPEPQDGDAERGTRLHEAWEKEDPSELEGEDIEIYERGLKLVDEVKAQWTYPLVKEGPREERFYLRDDLGYITASGQVDRHFFCENFNAVLCIDFKSLWCGSLTPAELNWQARLLCVLMADEYSANHVRFAFLKPMLNKVDIVDYDREALERSKYSIEQILWESRQPDAQRRAGAHCRHCKAVSACPEAAAWQMLPSVQAKANGDAITPKVATELVGNISLLDCRKIVENATARHNIEDAAKSRLKALPEPSLAELGLMFGKPKVLHPITAVEKAFEFLLSVGIPADKLWVVTKMSNSELTAVVHQSLGLKSKKEAETWVTTRLASFITEQQCERPLKKI